MKTVGFAALLALGTPAHAGEGRVVFVCNAGTATCELAAERFEARSRAERWHLAGRAAILDELTEADLALAAVVVTIDAHLYRHWLLSIRRLEAWNDIPPVERDRAGAQAAIDRGLQALAASFARRSAGDEAAEPSPVCPARDYACFMAKVTALREGMTRADVERRLGPPTGVAAAEPVERWRDTVLTWSLHEFTEQRPEHADWSMEVSLAQGRIVQVRTIGWLER